MSMFMLLLAALALCSRSSAFSAEIEPQLAGAESCAQSGEVDDDAASLLSVSVLSMRNTKASIKASQAKPPESFCEQGRMLPSLYLLGAQKAATTSLSSDFVKAGVRAAVESEEQIPESDKEFGFWEKEFRFWDLHEVELSKVSALRDEWMSTLPSCDQQVVADFSPSNLRKTPLPKGTMPTGNHYSQFINVSQHNISLASFLPSLYGQTLASKLVFVVLLREPVSRMQSAYYHGLELYRLHGLKRVCVDCNGANFSDALGNSLATAKTTGQIHDWMWESMYGYHFDDWFKHFSPDQFAVIPYHLYTHAGAGDICKYVSSRLGTDMVCHKELAPHANSHSHPPLDEDAPASLLAKARDYFAADKDRLAKVLSEASSRGAFLPGLAAHASVQAVADWLDQNW
mmetsp:Transcript_27355/g.43812  ORF Transcript_27355/g.43812 Transcript_27355/m.43812 type:complete len:401 (+) Transcript_27355:42-1244(+)